MEISKHQGVAALPVANRGLLTLGVMLAMIMQVLDTTIANVAVPHMQSSLGATIDTVTWVLTSYIIASAVAIPITGWLSDTLGSRRLFLISVGGFIIASVLCGLATNLGEMVLFRVAQGGFGAFLSPLSQTVMLDINPPERQRKAMGIWAAGIMVAPIMGPVIGGWLTENFAWRWVFYVNLPVGIGAYALLWWLLPSRPKIKREFDLLGFTSLAIALACLQLFLDRGSQLDWFDSWEIRAEAFMVIAAGGVFVIQMMTAEHPLFDRHVMTDRNMLIAVFFISLMGLVMMSVMALLPQMLQNIYHYSVVNTGMMLAPRGVGVLMSMTLVGRLGAKLDLRLLVGLGLLSSAASLWQMSHWTPDMDWFPIIISGFTQGIGFGLLMMPINMLAFTTLAARYRTEAASLMNLMRNLSASVGISMVTTLLTRNMQINHADMASHLDPAIAGQMVAIGPVAMAVVDAEVNRQALMVAYLDDFRLILVMIIISLPMVILLKAVSVKKAGDELPMME